jgi:hypothetical protein
MTTATRGLVRYEGAVRGGNGSAGEYASHDNAWQDQVDMAASCLAAAALTGGLRKAAGAMSERQLARYLASQASRRRRMGATKLAVIMIGEVIALAAGCYIGLLG